MKGKTKRTGILLLSTAGLVAGSAVLPASASAAHTECEPGSATTTFDHSAVSTSEEAIGSETLTNTGSVEAFIPAPSGETTVDTASITGPVPFEAILPALQAEVNPTAVETSTFSRGVSVMQMMLPAGESHDITYGFTRVSFSGTQQECRLDGLFGPAVDFSGTAPTGVYVAV